MQLKLKKIKSIDRHANVLELKLSPWFGQNPSTGHFRKKLHSPTDKLTKEPNCTTKSIAQNTQNLFVFHLLVSFRLKLRFHMTAFHTLAT